MKEAADAAAGQVNYKIPLGPKRDGIEPRGGVFCLTRKVGWNVPRPIEGKNMELTTIIAPIFILALGACLGYYARQMLAAKRAGTIEKNIASKLAKAKAEAQKISDEAQTKSQKLLEASRQEVQTRSREIAKTETLILKRESTLEQKVAEFEAEEKEFQEKVKKLRVLKENLEELHRQAVENLERIGGLTKTDARQELLDALEKEYQKDLLDRTKELETEGIDRKSVV